MLNPVSGGKKRINWEPEIRKYFLSRNDTVEFFMLTGKDDTDSLQYWFSKFKPDRVIAVGGDGTISMVAKQIMGTNIILGILPAGSANGMAKELQIPDDPLEAIRLITDGEVKCCDIIKVNNENICFHLSDLGLNARLIKYFDDSSFRGMWGYARMVFKVLWRKKLMDAHILADGLDMQTKAYMVVIANASKYGTGAVINPDGKVDDAKFEIIVLRKISIIQFAKMFWSYKTFNPQNVEIFHTTQATITTRHDTHFQIDGEFKGKINKVTAKIVPSSLNLLVKQMNGK